MKALRAVVRHGMLADLVHRNPARDVEYLRSGSTGFHTWTADEVAQFKERHPVGSKPRLALALLLFTGQRRSDVVQLGRQHLKDGYLTFVQIKNRNRKPVRLSIPMLPELQRIIAATPGTATTLTFLSTSGGRPYSPDAFGNVFRAWCRQAGLPHCSAHGLRKAAASRLAELGASVHEIAAVTGHRSFKEVQRYTVGAEQKRLAASALARLSGEQSAQESPTRAEPTPQWDGNDPEPLEKKRTTRCMVPRGDVRLASPDPDDEPDVDFNWLSDQRDFDRMVEAYGAHPDHRSSATVDVQSLRLEILPTCAKRRPEGFPQHAVDQCRGADDG